MIWLRSLGSPALYAEINLIEPSVFAERRLQ